MLFRSRVSAAVGIVVDVEIAATAVVALRAAAATGTGTKAAFFFSASLVFKDAGNILCANSLPDCIRNRSIKT